MKIGFERSGGFAGMVKSKKIDTSTLPNSEFNQLRQLLETSDFFRLPAKITDSTPQADRFEYQVTVEDNGNKHTVTVGEKAISGKLKPLLDWLDQVNS